MKKTCRGAWLFLLVLFSWRLPGSEIRGTVRDIYDRAVPQVRIALGSDGETVAVDENGNFSFSVAEGTREVRLFFAAPRHYPEKRVVVPRNASRPLKVYLIPLKILREEVTVTALNQAEKTFTVPFAQTVVSEVEISESLPETVVQAAQNSPGVHFIGKGGIGVTPSIRGLARRRILLLADGARVTSDRSAGAAASFYPPEFIGRLEIVRSAASVLYGSDAIGGVLHIISRDGRNSENKLGSLNVSGSSADRKWNGGISLNGKIGAFSLLAAFQAVHADDYRSAGARILNSGFANYAGALAASYGTEKRELDLHFLRSRGTDIGKPERANSAAVSSFYPLEETNLLAIDYLDRSLFPAGSLNVSLFVNSSRYELDKTKAANRQTEIAKNSSLDMGVRAFVKKNLNRHWRYQCGLDFYGRRRVDMENEIWKNGELGSRSIPLRDGGRDDVGIYATVDYANLAAFDLVAGARLGSFKRQAYSDGIWIEKTRQAPAFFLGLTRRIGDSLAVFANVGTAFRVPSLSEAYYTGLSGRNSIVGNPDLRPEKSVNLDSGIRIRRKNWNAGLYFFQCTIADMIEKFPLSDTAYTYDNIERGRIRGLELEFQVYPLKSLELFGNGFYYRGSAAAGGRYLNDVPSAKLFLGAKFRRGRFWSEVDWLASAPVKHPGPAEVAVPAYGIVDVKAGFYFSGRFFLFMKAANLFNRDYFANADPDIPPAKGFDLSLGMNLNF